jgi:hypothetical protein
MLYSAPPMKPGHFRIACAVLLLLTIGYMLFRPVEIRCQESANTTRIEFRPVWSKCPDGYWCWGAMWTEVPWLGLLVSWSVLGWLRGRSIRPAAVTAEPIDTPQGPP